MVANFQYASELNPMAAKGAKRLSKSQAITAALAHEEAQADPPPLSCARLSLSKSSSSPPRAPTIAAAYSPGPMI